MFTNNLSNEVSRKNYKKNLIPNENYPNFHKLMFLIRFTLKFYKKGFSTCFSLRYWSIFNSPAFCDTEAFKNEWHEREYYSKYEKKIGNGICKHFFFQFQFKINHICRLKNGYIEIKDNIAYYLACVLKYYFKFLD